MSVVGCGFCSHAIRYHGEPEGTEPVEHVFCRLDKWRELEAENLTADRLEIEHDGIFFYADRCVRCNTFMFFNDCWKNIGTYTPNEEFSSAPMQEPFDFGPFWDDFLWFDITETGTPTAEVLTRYPQNLWLAKNEFEMRLYSDEARTNCVGQFSRLKVVTPITVETMSLKSFKKMLARWDDVEFFYRGQYYNFMREDGEINVWFGHDYIKSVYRVPADTNVDDIVNAKIFSDGKSIAEAQAEVEL
ncbi:MAG: hypothetical protein IJ774_12335 [Selenomonadaceae bacterium]|nr:hypothetical protein [Selenomonadaceae bacterium]